MLICHPWITKIKERIDDIASKYQSDPEKMILKLNQASVSDSFFTDGKYFTLDLSKAFAENNKLTNKKRKREKGSSTQLDFSQDKPRHLLNV